MRGEKTDKEGPVMLLNFIRRALTRTIMLPGRKRAKQQNKYQLPPRESLVYGITVAIAFFFGLCALQIAHMLILGSWNDAIWAGLTFISGIVLGAFFGGRT